MRLFELLGSKDVELFKVYFFLSFTCWDFKSVKVLVYLCVSVLLVEAPPLADLAAAMNMTHGDNVDVRPLNQVIIA